MANHAHRVKIQDDINTDYIISGRYKFKIQDPKELQNISLRTWKKAFIRRSSQVIFWWPVGISGAGLRVNRRR